MTRSSSSGPGETQGDAVSRQERPRRNFVAEILAIIVGGVVGIFPLLTGLVVFLDPLKKRKDKAASNLLRVAMLDAIPDDGLPRRFPVVADRVDAWNRYPNEPIGSVFLRRRPGESTVQAFNTTCPHLGCGISLAQRGKNHIFRCPCHMSSFDLDGEKIITPGKINPSPRSMDSLEIDEKLLAEKGEIWVHFMDFYTGTHEKIVKA